MGCAVAIGGRPHRLRALVFAYDLSPAQGSECGNAWDIVSRLAKYHDLTVICADGSQTKANSYRLAVEQWFSEHGRIEGLRIVHVEHPPRARWLSKLNQRISGMKDGVGNRLLFYLTLRIWQRDARRWMDGPLLEKFDIVHHVTPLAFWGVIDAPTNSTPLVWGPVSGLAHASLRVSAAAGKRQFLADALRSLFSILLLRGSPRIRRALSRSTRTIAATQQDALIVEKLTGRRVTVVNDSACTARSDTRLRRYDGARALVLCWSGLHIQRKALPLLFKALAALPERSRVKLYVLGNGPLTSKWKAFSSRLGLDSLITWRGRVSHAEAMEIMNLADVFVLTSVRESGPTVGYEALSLGLPVVCHEVGGIGSVVDATCGIKIPLKSGHDSVVGFKDAIETLLHMPELVEQLSRGSMLRAKEATFDRAVQTIAAEYFAAYAKPAPQTARIRKAQGLTDSE
jgi:glycosyltransferase involved in cell wall biosynthesis